MTVNIESSSETYNGDGITVNFPTVFVFNVETDITVTERDISTGVETPKTLTTDYTVTGGGGTNVDPQDGTVIANVAPPSGVTWTLLRAVPEVQGTALPTAGPLPAKSIEGMSDRLTMIAQQQTEQQARSLTYPETDPSVGSVLPSTVGRASKFLAFDAAGNVVAVAGTGGGYVDPLTTRGDMLRRGTTFSERFPIGTPGQVLVAGADDPDWGGVALAGLEDGTAGNLISYATTGEAVAVATGTAGQVLTSNGAGNPPTMQATSAPTYTALLHVIDEKTTGTSGGTFTSGAFRTRDLNTVKTNEITGASLAANAITLPAGTYRIEAEPPAARVDNHIAKLVGSISGDILTGTTGYDAFDATGGGDSMGVSEIFGQFTLAVEEDLTILHRCNRTDANGFGIASNLGLVETYTSVRILRLG